MLPGTPNNFRALPTDSIISIAEILESVNRLNPDILPEDVLKHFGHDRRPNGKLGSSALFSTREIDLHDAQDITDMRTGYGPVEAKASRSPCTGSGIFGLSRINFT